MSDERGPPCGSSPPPAGDGSTQVAPGGGTPICDVKGVERTKIMYSRKHKKKVAPPHAQPATQAPPHAPPTPTAGVGATQCALTAMVPQVLRCAVTVVFVSTRKNGWTFYGTGVVVMCHNNHAFIFTKNLEDTEHYMMASTAKIYIQFPGCSRQKQPALKLPFNDSNYMMIVAPQERKMNQVTSEAITIPQPKNGASYEKCCTIGTMSGTKLHAYSQEEEVLSYFMGRLGVYVGKVLTPDCKASSHSKIEKADSSSKADSSKGDPSKMDDPMTRPVVGESENYFTLSCPFKDEMVTPENIDVPSDEHTSTRILGAPVFRSSGEMLGVIHSSSNYFDVKYGLHVHEMTARITEMCSIIEEELDWKEKLARIYQEVSQLGGGAHSAAHGDEPQLGGGAQPAALGDEPQLGGGAQPAALGDEPAQELLAGMNMKSQPAALGDEPAQEPAAPPSPAGHGDPAGGEEPHTTRGGDDE